MNLDFDYWFGSGYSDLNPRFGSGEYIWIRYVDLEAALRLKLGRSVLETRKKSTWTIFILWSSVADPDPGDFRGSDPGVFRGSDPGDFHGSDPGVFRGSDLGVFHGSDPGVFRGSDPVIVFLDGRIRLFLKVGSGAGKSTPPGTVILLW